MPRESGRHHAGVTVSRLALGILVVAASACTDRVFLDEEGLILDTDGETDGDTEMATDEGGVDTGFETEDTADDGTVDTGCMLGDPQCPCPAGQVPQGGVCVDAVIVAFVSHQASIAMTLLWCQSGSPLLHQFVFRLLSRGVGKVQTKI